MAFLPASGTISYNGYTFNVATRTRIVGRPVYDRAGRTITHVVYTINLTSFIPEATPGATTDTDILDIRQRLNSPGRDLTISGQGFGTFTINTATMKDVVWGPKPTLLALEPVGSKALWRIDWQVEVAIPECSAAVYSLAVMAFNYDINYSIDGDGYTVRTYSGYLEIPMTRAGGGRAVPDSADNYRERIIIPLLDGFRRASQTFTLSDDKRRLDWSIVDEEMPVEGLPFGCTDASGNHSIRPQVEGLTNWVGHITATYTVARNRPRSDAYAAFFALYDDRRRQAESVAPSSMSTGGGAGPVVRLVSLEIDQGLYRSSRTISFSATYYFVCSLDRLLEGSGIWRPVPNTDARLWSASVQDVLGVRGAAQLGGSGGEMIIDLCGNQTSLTGAEAPNQALTTEQTTRTSLSGGGFIDFQQTVDFVERPGWSSMKALPQQATAELTTGLARGASLAAGGVPTPTAGTDSQFDTLSNVQGDPGRPPTIYYLTPFGGSYVGVVQAFQQIRLNVGQNRTPQITPGKAGGEVPQARVASGYTIRIRGFAVAVGIAPQCPALQQFEDADLIPEPTEQSRFSIRTVGYNLDQPIFHAEWFLSYRAIYPNGVRRAS